MPASIKFLLLPALLVAFAISAFLTTGDTSHARDAVEIKACVAACGTSYRQCDECEDAFYIDFRGAGGHPDIDKCKAIYGNRRSLSLKECDKNKNACVEQCNK